MKWIITPARNAALLHDDNGVVRGGITRSKEFALGFVPDSKGTILVSEQQIKMRLLGAYPSVEMASVIVKQEFVMSLRFGRHPNIIEFE